ncbi:hypothetical protein ACFV99_08255 [Streptomyces sp. NPDC059944]|uniref:hypothetical protein n=1 Tax=unclassified Streptomyces TaxID=2593676 RepID=UPI00365144EC
MKDQFTLINGASADTTDAADTTQQGARWRFSVVPPKDIRTEMYRKLKAVRRPSGTLALPAIATTAGLHFTHVLHHGDDFMALGLTALVVGYDAVIAVCRTWVKVTANEGGVTQKAASRIRRAA